jgi:SAM-dependent methyltransferase
MGIFDNPRVAFRIRKVRIATARNLEKLAAAATPAPTPNELRHKVGGAWDEIGQLQFDFLVSEGLKPDHTFLDLGCGVLRGGLHFIRYLDPGRYYGIDANPEMIIGAGRELEAAGLTSRDAHLRATETFDIDFGTQFDYGLALSVFTHLPLNSIYRALANIAARFTVGGTFYATYFPGPDGPERFVEIAHPSFDGHFTVRTFADENSYHYSVRDFELLCERLPLTVDNIGDWAHPRGQHMLRFTRTV